MIKNKLKIGLVFALVMMFSMTSFAGAANLTYTAETTVDLSDPDINLTIKSGSEATSLVVNTGTIDIVVPSGSTFIVTSASRGLTLSGSAAGESISQTCDSSYVDTLTITVSSGNGTYTITPNSDKCSYSAGGGGGGGTYTPPATSDPEPETTAPTSDTGEVEATAGGGGSVTNTNEDGSSAEVVLPADAVTEATTVTVTPVAETTTAEMHPVPSGSSVVGDYVYNFTAVSGTTAVTTFEKAVTVTLTYTDAQITGLTEGTLQIHYWDDTTSAWVALTDSTVNTATNTVTATTTHFTYFAILGTQTSEEETTTPTTPSTEVIDGDIIQCASSSNPFAVYIVKVVGDTKYIRHIVSLEIFNYYGHLKWENLKQVDSLTPYSLSGWARVNTGPNGTPGPTDKVYEINGDQSKHWINMTAEDFLAHGGSDPAIYTVNQGEMNLYTTGVDVMSL